MITANESGTNNVCLGVNAYGDASGQMVLGSTLITDVIVAGKRISFNEDGTVTWSSV